MAAVEKIQRVDIEAADGSTYTIRTCVGQRYTVWKDRAKRWRWALRRWPDDGYGFPTHGAEGSLREAVAACQANWDMRQEAVR